MTRRSKRPPATVTCPYCGEPNKAGALACRSCGADADTGWKDAEELAYQEVDLPTWDDDDYAKVIADIEGRPIASRAFPAWVYLTAIVLLAVFAIWVLGLF
ncbi:MAG: zinc ribbon domain-containing protein [Planctomycetes bacterium]|nr:zinc ribbon domain-containing protein [Planctomycetota bacterium]MCB9891559.1 zinc ribbon domain-containing protein [Planctomycetota bacterium]